MDLERGFCPPFPNPYPVVGGVSSVFKECDFGPRMEGEIYSKALTFPIDNLLLERVSSSSLDEASPYLDSR